jgi:hypothetical protein
MNQRERPQKFLLPVQSSGYWAIQRLYLGRSLNIPEKRETIEYIREISTGSEKYCPTDFCKEYFQPAPEIADGPLVVAQEVYHQRPFDAGVAKSRITLISYRL